MAILVLGGAGYIGSHMVDRLVNEGQEKSSWLIVWSQATVQRCIQMPSLPRRPGGQRLYAHCV